MLIRASGLRVKVYPVCLECSAPGKRQDGEIVVAIRGEAEKGRPLDGVVVRVSPDSADERDEHRAHVCDPSANACDKNGIHITAQEVLAEAPADDIDWQARIPVYAIGPELGTERLCRARIEVVVPGDGRVGDTGKVSIAGHVDICASTDFSLPLWQTLKEEYLELNAGDEEWRQAIEHEVTDPPRSENGQNGGAPRPSDTDLLRTLFEIMHGKGRGLAALCLSGGGIRSATFNLGVLQGLARVGLLERFDYLSSVSGGGYIASWLSAWIHRTGIEDVVEKLSHQRTDPLAPEPPEIRHLRQYSNYLSPRSGFLSADSWTLAAIFVRNLILNQLVLIPILAAFLALPLLAAARPPDGLHLPPSLLFTVSVLVGFIAFYEMNALRFRECTEHREGRSEGQMFLLRGLVPLLVSAGLMVMAVAWAGPLADWHWFHFAWRAGVFAVLMPVAAYTLAAVRAGHDKTLWIDVTAATVAGLVVAAIYTWIPVYLLPLPNSDRYPVFAWLAPALVLLPVLIGKTLFTGFISIAEDFNRSSEKGDAEREWWARWSAWVLIALLAWLVLSGVVLFGPWLLKEASAQGVAYLAGGGLGFLTSLLGKAATTPATNGQPQKRISWSTLALAVVAPLFCVVLAILISDATQALVWFMQSAWFTQESLPWTTDSRLPASLHFNVVLIATVGLACIGSFMGLFVNVNRFSLQAMYRNRLVRAYLGASRSRRRPSRFTGFDPKDNLRLCMLRQNRPLPVLNMALNLVNGSELAWQERKAASFTATPLHCGTVALRPGYRRTPPYAGEHGISLATAMATSGAAANPSMGQSSSPAVAFIMALFNARLGIWLGNPGEAGSRRRGGLKRSFTRAAPRNSARSIFAEAFGYTDEKHPYVNLSDGGHFDNLGLYEMVLRRCRWIVVCDAGCDRGGEYSDLGSAIRKIRVDFGIPIEFHRQIDIASATEPRSGRSRCAVAEINYAAVDGPDAKPGTLIYIKPTICGDEPRDIFNYVRTNGDFPHETTADQWFSESQFESYRALGAHTVTQIMGGGGPPSSFHDVVGRVEDYLNTLGIHDPRPSVNGSAVPTLEDAARPPGHPSPPIGDWEADSRVGHPRAERADERSKRGE